VAKFSEAKLAKRYFYEFFLYYFVQCFLHHPFVFLLLTCLSAKVNLFFQRESKIKPPFFGINLLAVAKIVFSL